MQIVTKSGSNQFHGTVGGYFAPQQLERQRLFSDDSEREAPLSALTCRKDSPPKQL